MASNLVDLVKDQVGPNLLRSISNMLGESQEKVQTGLSGAIPSVLAGIVGTVSQPEGARTFSSALQQQDPSLLGNLAGMLDSNGRQSVQDKGTGLLSSLLGDTKLGGLSSAISGFSGISSDSAKSLLGVVGPMVMGVLRREQRTAGLNNNGMVNMLMEQKDNIARAMPSGLTNMLGSSGVLEGISDRLGAGVNAAAETAASTTRAATARTRAAAATTQRTASTGWSWLRWAIPIVAIALILWIGSRLLFKSETVQNAAQQAADKVATTTARVTESARQLMVEGVDLGSEINGVFASTTKTLQGITDTESARAALPTLNQIQGQLSSLTGQVDQLPAEGKMLFAGMVDKALPGLQALVDKLNAMPGVGEVLQPALKPMMEKLSAWAQA
jgi:hypothetical protein